MKWRPISREALVSGTIASVLSTVALLVAGRIEARRPAAPVNATSHWLWGDRALAKDEPTWKHTLTGYLIHHAASVFWAALHAAAWQRMPQPKRALPALATATAAAGVASFVDFRLTPDRLTPGFEHRLSKKALGAVYAAFAVGLAVGSVLSSRR